MNFFVFTPKKYYDRIKIPYREFKFQTAVCSHSDVVMILVVSRTT